MNSAWLLSLLSSCLVCQCVSCPVYTKDNKECLSSVSISRGCTSLVDLEGCTSLVGLEGCTSLVGLEGCTSLVGLE